MLSKRTKGHLKHRNKHMIISASCVARANFLVACQHTGTSNCSVEFHDMLLEAVHIVVGACKSYRPEKKIEEKYCGSGVSTAEDSTLERGTSTVCRNIPRLSISQQPNELVCRTCFPWLFHARQSDWKRSRIFFFISLSLRLVKARARHPARARRTTRDAPVRLSQRPVCTSRIIRAIEGGCVHCRKSPE